jgi:two-component system sensor histidine kinase QseC
MKLYSLRRTTLSAILAPLMLGTVTIALSANWLTSREVGELRDDQMAQQAAFLMAMAKHENAEGNMIGTLRAMDWQEMLGMFVPRVGFRIWSKEDLIVQSGSNPEPAREPKSAGFGVRESGDRTWRTLSVHDFTLPVTIEVNEPTTLRSSLVNHIVLGALLPLILLVVSVCAVAFVQVTLAMRPMKAISADIDARPPDDFRPFGGYLVPNEIAPLFAAFNRLLARLRDAIEREREFADNAAHELRTPLAALKTRAQIAARDLASDPDRQHVVKQLVDATDRATGVINHLLLINRMHGSTPNPQTVDLSAVTEKVARELAPNALAKNQRFGVKIEAGIVVPGHIDALAMAIRNGIDNAIRYTPGGSRISVLLSREGDDIAVLRILDNGPGIPAGDLERATERYVRLTHDQPGSGLGLSISLKIIEQHGGTFSIRNRKNHGLVLVMRLPTSRRPDTHLPAHLSDGAAGQVRRVTTPDGGS